MRPCRHAAGSSVKRVGYQHLGHLASMKATWPHQVIASFWLHRRLVFRLAEREILSRYRGSIFGIAWALIGPAAMVVVYSFVFGIVMKARWPGIPTIQGSVLAIFVGVTVFQIVAECLNRAPRLVIEHATYVKKVVFPLEALGWILMLSALASGGFALLAFLAAHLYLVGLPPVTALALPILILPLILMMMGVVWALSALGVFLRDLSQIVQPITTALMFLTPIFYSTQSVPPQLAGVIRYNPLSYVIDWSRGALLYGTLPSLRDYLVLCLVGAASAWLGLAWFNATKSSFADVL